MRRRDGGVGCGACVSCLANTESGTPRGTVRPHYEGLPLMAGRGADERGRKPAGSWGSLVPVRARKYGPEAQSRRGGAPRGVRVFAERAPRLISAEELVAPFGAPLPLWRGSKGLGAHRSRVYSRTDDLTRKSRKRDLRCAGTKITGGGALPTIPPELEACPMVGISEQKVSQKNVKTMSAILLNVAMVLPDAIDSFSAPGLRA